MKNTENQNNNKKQFALRKLSNLILVQRKLERHKLAAFEASNVLPDEQNPSVRGPALCSYHRTIHQARYSPCRAPYTATAPRRQPAVTAARRSI